MYKYNKIEINNNKYISLYTLFVYLNEILEKIINLQFNYTTKAE